MSFRLRGKLRLTIVALALTCFGALAIYQNCSGSSATGLGGSSSASINSALASQPMPLVLNFNQISYMSCPATFSRNTSTPGDPIGSPFYQLRFGSYNNTSANGLSAMPTGSTSYPNNIAGLALSTAAMNYMRSMSANPTAAMLTNYISSSPYSGNSQPVVALVNRVRSACTPTNCSGLSNDAAAKALLTPISAGNLVADLANAPQISGAGTQANGYFSDIAAGINSVVGSLNSTITDGDVIADESSFRTNEIGNLSYLVAGFAPSTALNASAIIQGLQSPDGTSANRIFGRGYALQFSASRPAAVSGISEYDLSTSTISPTPVAGSWQCLNLTVVRDIDRKYFTTMAASTINSPFLAHLAQLAGSGSSTVTFPAQTPVHPMDVSSFANLQVNYLRDTSSTVANTNSIPYVMYNLSYEYTKYAAALGIPAARYTSSTFGGAVPAESTVPLYMGYGSFDGGNYYSCPPEDASTLINNPTALQELKVIRRFLAPEYWDVNITQRCAVPKTASQNMGSCYPGGDTDYNSYVQYNGVPGSTCYNGTTGSNSSLPICPAVVSVCYRYQ